MIVAPDADLESALPRLAKGGFYHAGQVCVSVQRIFAHRSIIEQVAAELGRLAGQLRVGDPTLPDTEVGPLIRPQEVARIDASHPGGQHPAARQHPGDHGRGAAVGDDGLAALSGG